MSIFLSIQTEDREVETLLSFVQTHLSHLSAGDQICAMERAMKWLRATDEMAFNLNSQSVTSLKVDAYSPIASAPASCTLSERSLQL